MPVGEAPIILINPQLTFKNSFFHPVIVVTTYMQAMKSLFQYLKVLASHRLLTPQEIHILCQNLSNWHYVTMFSGATQERHFKSWSVTLSQSCATAALAPMRPSLDPRTYSRIVINTILHTVDRTAVSTDRHLLKAPSIWALNVVATIHNHSGWCKRRPERTTSASRNRRTVRDQCS